MNLLSLSKRMFFKEQVQYRQLLIDKGGAGKEAKEAYELYFKYPSYRFHYPNKKYDLGKKIVLEVGVGRGQDFIHFGQGSYGIDDDKERIKFCTSIGLKNLICCNVEEDLPVPDDYFEAVWCSNILEHVLSPHYLLRRLYNKLRRDGLLFVGVPLIPASKILEKFIRIYMPTGYRQESHINAFTKRTVEFFIIRSGFEVLESGLFPFSNVHQEHLVESLGKVHKDGVVQLIGCEALAQKMLSDHTDIHRGHFTSKLTKKGFKKFFHCPYAPSRITIMAFRQGENLQKWTEISCIDRRGFAVMSFTATVPVALNASSNKFFLENIRRW